MTRASQGGRQGWCAARMVVLGPWVGIVATPVMAAVVALIMALLAFSAVAQPAAAPLPAGLRFREPVAARPASPGARLLDAEERAFLATLPVVRVAVPVPPAEPYERIEADGTVTGIHPEMLVALGKAFGIRMRPVPLPGWSAVLEAARRREVDLVMTIGVTPQRLQVLEFTLGATPLPGALFGRAGSEVPLERARFAIERDYLANEHVRRQYPQAAIVVADDTAAALRAVAEGRADYHLGSLLESLTWLERTSAPGVQVLRLHAYGTGYYHFGVRKDWAPLARILNKGIEPLRAQTPAQFEAALAALGAGTAPRLALRPPPPPALPPAAAEVLARRPLWRVGAVRGLAMLNEVDEQGLHSGIAAEYTEQVARRLGVAVQVVPFANVAAMLQGLRSGAIDLVPFLTRTTQRAREFGFSRPYLELPYMLVERADGPLHWGLDSLRGGRVALALEHPLRERIAASHPDITVVDAANGNAAMDLVARGQADAAVEVRLFANLRVNADPGQRLRLAGPVDELPAQFHFATAASAAELLPLVDLALADIGDDERRRMLRRWIAVDLQPAFPWRRYLPLAGLAGGALALLAGLTVWWMRRLQREVQARRRSEELLGDIATTVPGVAFRYVLDEAGALAQVYVTPGVKAFLGIDPHPQRTLLASMAPHIDAEQREAVLAQEAACAASGERFKATVRYQAPSGPARWLHSEAVRTRDGRGRVVWTGYVVDVSTERELQQRLAREAAARNLLLASASHELRAPTHNLSLALQSVDAASLAPAAAQALRIAQRSAHTLTQLLNDVLDAARFDTGPMKLRPTPFSPRDLLEELAEAWSGVARAKGLEFALRIEGELPPLLVHDPLRLRQVLTNLLSNACKYTTRGEVVMQARADAAELRVAVHDTGPGLDADAQARLFQPFVTLDEQAPGSSGLGLAICRRIAALMGGRIELASAPGRGSTFTLHLPLAAAPAVAKEPAAGHDAVATPAGQGAGAADPRQTTDAGARRAGTAAHAGHIVVCDDDPVSRILCAQMLRLRGYRVLEAGDGDTALAAWRDGGVRALVTDLDMPGLQGRELIRRLRESEHERRTVVIVCSGSPLPAGAEATPLQHDAYLLKPVAMEALVGTLQAHGIEPLATQPAADAAATPAS